MICRSCQYSLFELATGPCPECGRPFDPADPSTFETRRRGQQALLGLGLAVVIGIVMITAFWFAQTPDYGFFRHAAFWTLFGSGLVVGSVTAILAAANRSWLGRVPLLLVGILSVWIGLFLGSDKFYRVWQSMPNPASEAFADTAPIGALLLGWMPGMLVVGSVFGLSFLLLGWCRRRARSKSMLRSNQGDVSRSPISDLV
jgi:hypothetical protein